MKITKNHKHTVTAGRTARARQFGIKAARVGKTKLVYVLQGNYGYGWDDLCEYEKNQLSECKADLKAYRENQPANYRIIERRVPNPDYKENPVEQSTTSKRKYTIKASSDSYSMADYDIVIYRNSEKVYSGSVYDYSFSTAIKTLCKDSENLRVFTEWLSDYGVSDLEDSDIPTLVIEMITSDWEEATENDEDFYEEISMYGYQHSDVRFEVFYAKDEVKASTATKCKYTVKASKSAKRKKRVMAGRTMPYTKWVFDGDDGQWKMWGGANSPTVDDGFLDRINHPNYPNPEYNVENNYTDVIVLPAGEEPNDGRPVKAATLISANTVYDEDGYSQEDNVRYEREQFAERIVHEIEDEYSIKVSDDAWGTIYDLADDLSFGADAQKHGSDPMWVLEDTIYDIIEEETGVVIGSVIVSASQGMLSDMNWVIWVFEETANQWELWGGSWSRTVAKNFLDKINSLDYEEGHPDAGKYYTDVIVLPFGEEPNDGRSVKACDNITAAQADTTVSYEDVDELVLYITNDGDLYRGRASSIIKNLKRKSKNGNYDKDLAVKAWQYLADDGVRKYDKEFGSGSGSVAWLNPATRKAIATELRDYYEEEIFYEDSVTSAVATNHNSPRTYDTDNKRDAEYLNALGKGVVKDLSQSVGDTTVHGGGDFIYEISDSAITFMASGDGAVLYIQPLDHIEPNMDDLEVDIEELSSAIYSEIMPKF